MKQSKYVNIKDGSKYFTICPYCGRETGIYSRSDRRLVSGDVHLYECTGCGKTWELITDKADL